jgi:methionine transaminase
MMLSIHSKLPKVGTTIFTTMSALANKHNAINLGQGFPDMPMNADLIELTSKAMRNGLNQYVHQNGYPPLRQALAKKVNTLYHTGIEADNNITITPGGTYAIYCALTTILQPSDEVIIFEPAYDSYIPNIEINGAKAVPIALEYPNYKINWDEVKERINNKTKAIIINSPHNPTGMVFTAADMQALEQLVTYTNIFVIADEVYEHLIFEGLQHQSVLAYPNLFSRAFVCFSFGKTYHCTGWKLGYCIAPTAYMSEYRKIHQFNAFTCDTPKQAALAEFLSNEDAYLNLGAEVQAHRDYFYTLMKSTKFELLPSYGSYFALAKYDAISTMPDLEFATWLTETVGVTTIPVSSFYHNGKDDKVVRFCFAKSKETLEAAATRLAKL